MFTPLSLHLLICKLWNKDNLPIGGCPNLLKKKKILPKNSKALYWEWDGEGHCDTVNVFLICTWSWSRAPAPPLLKPLGFSVIGAMKESFVRLTKVTWGAPPKGTLPGGQNL